MPPGTPQQPIPPRQPGESVYAYRKRRSIALTGQTPYQRRKASGVARGLSVAEARGHAPRQGKTEYQRRREQTLRDYGYTPWQIWKNQQIQWLNQNGYTPQTTGWSWSQLIKSAPRLRYFMRESPGAGVTPEMIMEATQMELTGELESEWSYDQLNRRYNDTIEWKKHHDRTLGNWHWFHDRIPELPVQWWYYH